MNYILKLTGHKDTYNIRADYYKLENGHLTFYTNSMPIFSISNGKWLAVGEESDRTLITTVSKKGLEDA